MQKNILVDLNVILDVLLERTSYKASQAVLESKVSLFVSGHEVTTFAYLLENAKVPNEEIRRNINWLLSTFSVVATTDDILRSAIYSKITDYEDAVIEQAAIECKALVIVTRNVKDFTDSVVRVVTPEDF